MKVSLTKIGRGGRAGAVPTLLVVALLLVTQVPRARAQSAQQDAPEPERREGARRPGRGPGDALMRRLNLTPEQRERLREIRAQSEGNARELTRRVRRARRALDEAIYADSSDESKIEHHARQLLDAQAELLKLRVATELKVRRVLTPTQLQTFRELRRRAQRRQRSQPRPRGAERPRPPADEDN